MKIVLISGGFDPIHSGHLKYIKEAKELGDKLVVALNSDEWLKKKKGKFFLPFSERKNILASMANVDEVIDFLDDEVGSVINALKDLKRTYPNDNIIFANGGDRNNTNIPEMKVKGINFQFGVGGSSKINSSSWILENWNSQREERVWGYFQTLKTEKNLKLKELVVKAGKGISYQRHFKRSEIWFVSKGKCKVKLSKTDPDKFEEEILNINDLFKVDRNDWHQIINPFEDDCHLIEIQYGSKVIEDDIERLYFYEENDD
ncbi:MAG: hypothetical protein CL851_06730 [Crocinitomicaceae bacterium]|nr:hypothetical protein [Crocinitomicaceae bacterium]|tara:strand:- start:2974 stop:3753 length:780 start_codon:yes stop_codon:yes gene_type:complete